MNVPEAQSEAQAAEAAREKALNIRKLAAVREQLQAAHEDYDRLSTAIHAGNDGIRRQQAAIDELTELLEASNRARPQVFEFLPDDSEVKAWKRQHDALTAERDRAIQKREEIRSGMPPLPEAAAYEGNFGRIANLERLENNLIRKLRGEEIGATWQGGVYRVL